jgi:hypothetical protein
MNIIAAIVKIHISNVNAIGKIRIHRGIQKNEHMIE